MMIPEACYRLTDLDLSGTLAEFIAMKVTAAAAAAAVTATLYTVPLGKILVIQTLGSNADPGAGQNVTLHTHRFDFQNSVFQINEKGAEAADVNSRLYELSGVGRMFPQGCAVKAVATFNSGVQINTVDGWLSGWLIPRGSVVI